MDTKQLKIYLYYESICAIGGIESWIYYFCQHLYRYYDITVLFCTGDDKQLERLSKIVKTRKYESNKKYICDVFVNATNWKPFPKNIDYKKCVAVVHCDYNYFKEQIKLSHLDKGIDELICVSKNCSDGLYKAFGTHGKVIENILGEKIETHKIYRFVSFTRLTEEKGLNRIYKMVEELRKANVKFEWKIFTEFRLNNTDYPELIFMDPTLDVFDYLVDSDYLVQLSSSEAFCYSVHEALQYGVPVIVTDIDAFKDVVIDGYNGYKVNLSMDNIDINKIINNIPHNFKYDENFKAIEKKWFDVLGKPFYKKDSTPAKVKLKVIYKYYDNELKKEMNVGDRIEVDEARAIVLTSGKNQINTKLCEYL